MPIPLGQPYTHVRVANTDQMQQALCILYSYSDAYMSSIIYAIEEDAMYLGGGTQEDLEGKGGCDHNSLYLHIKF